MSVPTSIAGIREVYREEFVRQRPEPGFEHIALRLWAGLLTSRAADCTNPRDKIYGTLGYSIIRDSDLIIPDYGKPVWQVYAETTRAILKDIGWLTEKHPGFTSYPIYIDWLGKIDEPSLRKQEGLPSWVPDYSLQGANPSPVSLAGQTSAQGRFFRAAGDLERHISFPDDLRLIEIKASRFDIITDTASSNDDMIENGGSFTDMLELVLNLDPTYITGCWRFDVFWRTLICDTVGHQHPAPDDCRALAMRYFAVEMAHRCFPGGINEATPEQWELLQRHRLLLQQLLVGQPPAAQHVSAVEQARTLEEMRRRDAGEHQSEDFTSGYREWYSWRRLFRTAQGYLGIGAQSLLVGDEVWIVPGSHAPLVLRPLVNGRYRLIGDAYVHGVMKGEALSMESWLLRHIVLE